MNSKFQILTYNNASSNNFDFNNKKIHYTPRDSMIHNFLDAPKIMDYENTIYFTTLSQKFHPLSLFKNIHLKKLIFPTLFYGQFQQFVEDFPYQQIA